METLSKKSAWEVAAIFDYLETANVPVRVAVLDGDYPLICSLWYEMKDQSLICVSHKNSTIAKLLQREKRCAFEVASNHPPYKGVRGKADVTVDDEEVESKLRRLIHRYLGSSNHSLAHWLLSRSEDELAFVLEPQWLTSWDYSNRMTR